LRRSNDDGEPSGTAGRPMLEAISGRDFIDSVAVVSRYFGGVLLGTGGLVRAYSDSVLATIDEAHARGDVVARERRALYTLALPHADAGRIEADLRHRGVNILGTAYGSRAVITLSGPGRSELHELVAAVTAGGGVLEAAGHELIDVEP
ncbi:MAG: YigZ family protein, partial [Microterricola sp.]